MTTRSTVQERNDWRWPTATATGNVLELYRDGQSVAICVRGCALPVVWRAYRRGRGSDDPLPIYSDTGRQIAGSKRDVQRDVQAWADARTAKEGQR